MNARGSHDRTSVQGSPFSPRFSSLDSDADLRKRGRGSERTAPRPEPAGSESAPSARRSSSATDASSSAARIALDGFPRLPPPAPPPSSGLPPRPAVLRYSAGRLCLTSLTGDQSHRSCLSPGPRPAAAVPDCSAVLLLSCCLSFRCARIGNFSTWGRSRAMLALPRHPGP